LLNETTAAFGCLFQILCGKTFGYKNNLFGVRFKITGYSLVSQTSNTNIGLMFRFRQYVYTLMA